MRLHYSSTSPFVRKVTVSAHELGLHERIERVVTKTAPTAPDPTLATHNPLGKIPALEVEPGRWIYDSPVICEYLDSLVKPSRLLPTNGAARWQVLRRQALADGVIDAAVGCLYESRRPKELQWAAWTDGQTTKIRQGLDTLEGEAPDFGDGFDLGLLTVACALGYLEFRKLGGNVREGRPRLFAWYDRVCSRSSLTATIPIEP